jgi:hypothetical protein
MKLLILILSYNSFPFDQFMDVQKTTWDEAKHPDIDTLYYYGDWLNCSDAYDMMHWKFKLCLDTVDYHQYDLIFRTNSCSYIVKDRILEVAARLPRTGCYSGWHNHNCVSGAGMFLSPDVLDVLREELTEQPHGAEDVLINEILRDRYEVIDDRTRIDSDLDGFKRFDGYHFRSKTSNDQLGRLRDINSLKELHEHLKRQRG